MSITMRKRILAMACVIGAIAATNGSADTIALSSFTGGDQATSGSDQLYGWQFSLSSSVDVSALGVFDFGNNGLSVSHDVGIFRLSDQSLVVSTTVPSGTPGFLDSGFRFVSLGSDVSLAAGEYVIAMTMPTNNSDFQFIEVSSETTSSPVTYEDSRFDGSMTLAFPTIKGVFAPGLFGPNFEFAGSAVPEPSTLVMAMAPIATGLILMSRRRVSRA
jgi:hypothetical protein